MMNRRTEPAQSGKMLGHAVTHMALEAVARMRRAEARHEAIARHLGDNRGGRDRSDEPIAAVEPLLRGGAAVELRSLGGAAARIRPDATAFAHRDAEVMAVACAMLPEAAPREEPAGWAPLAALGSGAYVNFLGSATGADIAAAYPPATYQRLAAIKRRYDPGNVFRRNHNIRPGGWHGQRPVMPT